MEKPNILSFEEERLHSLYSYHLLDTGEEDEFDQITALAKNLCGTDMAIVSIIDENRQWSKSVQGIGRGEAPRDVSFCAHAISQDSRLFLVEDALKDERFHDNPLVVNDPKIRFYAGVQIIGREGFPLGTLCVLDTKPHELEIQKRESLLTLANQVEQLLELRRRNIELQKSQDEIKKQNKELEKFAHVVSHDIKSPINNIIALHDLMDKLYGEQLGEEGRKFLHSIGGASKTLKKLIEGLLQYYKSAEEAASNVEEFFIHDVLNDVSELLSKTENFHLKYPADNISICTNRILLQQILLNLITNSIKYNHKDSIQVEVTVEEKGLFYHFKVADNGDGIDSSIDEDIFELFSNLGSTDRFGEKGTGIGLSTVKRAVENLGGEISFESEEKKGATFIFSIRKKYKK